MLRFWWYSAMCYRPAYCDCRTQKKKSMYVHTTFLHCAHQALRGFPVTEDNRPCVHRAVVAGQGDWRRQDGARRDWFPLRRCSQAVHIIDPASSRFARMESTWVIQVWHIPRRRILGNRVEDPCEDTWPLWLKQFLVRASACFSCVTIFSDLSCPKCLHPCLPFSFHDTSSHV